MKSCYILTEDFPLDVRASEPEGIYEVLYGALRHEIQIFYITEDTAAEVYLSGYLLEMNRFICSKTRIKIFPRAYPYAENIELPSHQDDWTHLLVIGPNIPPHPREVRVLQIPLWEINGLSEGTKQRASDWLS